MPRGFRTPFLFLISIGSLAATLHLVGFETVLKTLNSIHWAGILVAALLVLANNLLSLLRFRCVLRNFGFTPSWRSLFFAHSIGQVSNHIFLNVIGQSLSRAAALVPDGVPFGITVMGTYWERMQAAVILFLLSLGGLWYLFVHIHFDLLPSAHYLLLLAITFVVAVAVTATVLRPMKLLGELTNRMGFILSLWPCMLLTLAAHGCMLMAYISLLWGLGITPIDGYMVAALTIVMFTASLPISFSGWGIREFSAAQALGAIGVKEASAVAAAVAIGLLGLLLMAVFAAASTAMLLRYRRAYPQPSPLAAMPTSGPNGLILSVSAILCAVLLFFQVQIPLQTGALTGNGADVIVLTYLGLAPYLLWLHRRSLHLPKSLLISLAAVSAVFAASLLHGYISFGWTNWAFVNRGVGWLIILGYVATGLSVVLNGNDQHRRAILMAFIATGTTVAALQLGLLLTVMFGMQYARDVFPMPLRGYSGNPNAFAVQIAMTSAAAIAAYHIGIFGRHRALLPLILSILGVAIYFSHSRAGLVIFGIALACMMIFPVRESRRHLLPALLWPLAAIVVASYVSPIFNALLALVAYIAPSAYPENAFDVTDAVSRLRLNTARGPGDLERWDSITEGWTLWLEQPIFGSGLGAYMQGHLASTGNALVIHSVPVWLLAETGLVGFAIITACFIGVLYHAYRRLASSGGGWAAGLLLVLICIGAGCLVHDFFFQRSFWFLLGLFIALPTTMASRKALRV